MRHLGGALLTTRILSGGGRNSSRTFLNLLMSSIEEAESGDDKDDSSITLGEVTDLVKQLLGGRAPGGGLGLH